VVGCGGGGPVLDGVRVDGDVLVAVATAQVATAASGSQVEQLFADRVVDGVDPAGVGKDRRAR
jgi:hypothetical protein